MQRFKNILVGVNVSEFRDSSNGNTAPCEAAVRRATWLAQANAARLLYLYAAPPSIDALAADEARESLSQFVDDARRQGVTADQQMVSGTAWEELVRQVLRGGHDLVITGTRRFGPLRARFFGSTGLGLLRECPCPVWITQPQPDPITSVLVAHDLGPVGDLAMQLGSSLAAMHDAQLHVFHAIRFSELDSMFPSQVSADTVAGYRANAEQHVLSQLGGVQFSKPAQIHLEIGWGYSEILQFIQRRQIDVLVMGIVARTGIAGMMAGNTAERLLPHIPCSVVAVKPADFRSSVALA